MTSWQRLATNVKISRIFSSLLVLALLKLVVLGALGVDSVTSKIVNTVVPGEIVAEAQAADGDQPAADAAVPEDAAKAEQGAEAAKEGDQQAEDGPPPEGVDPVDWKALKKKERELADKERRLQALEASLDNKLAELNALEKNIKKMLDEATLVKNKKVKHLVDVYSNMKAKQAAAVLSTLEEPLAVKILSGMRGRQAGEILTFVEANKAARLSEALTRLQIPLEEAQ